MAQREGGSFTKMAQTVGAVNGVLELLSHTLNGPGGEPAEDVNWLAVVDLLDGYRDKLTGVHCALSELERYERKVDDAAQECRDSAA
jgi:hypothetical protein